MSRSRYLLQIGHLGPFHDDDPDNPQTLWRFNSSDAAATQWEPLRVQNGTAPGPRQFEYTWVDPTSGAIVVYGGTSGCETQTVGIDHLRRSCMLAVPELSDMWLLDTGVASAAAAATLSAAGSMASAQPPSWRQHSPNRNHNWPRFRVGSAFTTQASGEVWFFGGEPARELQWEMFPVDALWQFSPHPSKAKWTLVTGHVLDYTQMLTSKAKRYEIMRQQAGDPYGCNTAVADAHSFYECLNSALSKDPWRGIADDLHRPPPCSAVWPAVTFTEAQCPAGRTGAAAWSSAVDGTLWIFGGQVRPLDIDTYDVMNLIDDAPPERRRIFDEVFQSHSMMAVNTAGLVRDLW
jgi:hypothetical protein